ncbi:magnesium transporter MgtE N-terminal domain-containing protein [Acidobacterium sp. S8]|uniref:magnesium transporter MgtE N-terminal domain-containing protein n=1 Tax=Acidobacterium sp. S8 TaxID=1641854 RepID=UPI00131E48BB|nr:CBS domain-containing protein [Acidobacterium sp. S8]
MSEKHNGPSLSLLLGTPVTDSHGELLGRLKDVAVATGSEAGSIAGVVLKTKAGLRLVRPTEVSVMASGALVLSSREALQPLREDDNFLLLRQDLLDRQIIDVHGRKVVRVNDVDLQWFSREEKQDLRVREVEVGLRGAIRRLLLGVMPKQAIDRFARQFPARVIPWEFVDVIEVDPARRVKLKIEHERLAQLHPSDIADILESLAPAEREAILTTLDEEVAAETLEEVEPKLQKALVESLSSETAAAIVEEMDPSAAADLLAELPDERSEAILEEMNPEERQEVEDLLEFREDSAAGRMTTQFVQVSFEATVSDSVEALRVFDGDLETITEVYLVDDQEVLKGIVPLGRIVLAKPETRLAVLAEPRFITCKENDHQKYVAELFDKYNLRALPVLNDGGQLVGVVEADHVISFLRDRI